MGKQVGVYLNNAHETLLRAICGSHGCNESEAIRLGLRSLIEQVATPLGNGEIHIVLEPSPEDIVKSKLREVNAEMKKEDAVAANMKAFTDEVLKDADRQAKLLKAALGIKQ